MTLASGITVYTRRTRPNGTVRLFLRDANGKKCGVVEADAQAAATVPSGEPLTVEVLGLADAPR